MKHEMTSRGFKHLEPINDTYGSEIRVYESSTASGPHIWLNINSSSWNRESKPGEGVAHLSLDEAKELVKQLKWLMKNHYQVT